MDSYNFNNQQQEQIYRRLDSLVGPGSAAFYRDACRLMEMEPLLESTTHLVGHLLREIESSLRAVLKPIWEASKQPSRKNKLSNEDVHKTEILAVLQALEIPETSTVAQTWLSLPGKNSEYGLHRRAHRDDLASPRPIDEKFREFWINIQTVFDKVLERFETRYSDICRRLDELLTKPEPGTEDIKMLRNHVPNSLTGLGYFFEQLQFPGWLEPLRENGFFKIPSAPEVDPEDGGIRFLPWPQSRYLARMAFHDPATVLDIAIEILKKGTTNVFIHEDLAEAARAMPPELARSWVEQEVEWLKEQDYLSFSLAKKLGKLVTYLAENNQVNVALTLIQELLAILPSSESSRLLREPNARLNEYEYSQILENHVPKLLEVAEELTFEMLCCLLNDAVRLSPSQDYSHNWRATIEDNPYEIRERLISAVRDAAEQLLGKNPAAVCTLVLILESYDWTIFQRLALYFLRRFPNETQNLIAERLTNRERFQNQGELYEYKLLLREQFFHLLPEAQQLILDLIAGGPTDIPVSEDQRTAYIKYWQRNWLAILSDNLPTEWQQQYEKLVKEIGCAQPLEPTRVMHVWEGPSSPKSITELASMSMEELFVFLREWQPSGDLFEPSRNGLGWVLSRVIAQKPEDFVAEIEQFKQLDWEYMIWLLPGLQSALGSNSEAQQKFSWLQVVEFCSWMLEQLQEIRESSSDLVGGFNEWNHICEAVVSLLQAGLTATEEKKIPLEFRSHVWRILEALTNDSKLTPGFEIYYRGSNMRPVEASHNTVRGKAMHAILDYSLWVQRHTKKEESQEKQAVGGFDEIPEVREVLERHLNPDYDPSLVIRSIYGQWFSTLIHLDSDWAAKNQEKIFPTDNALAEHRHAAWEGYVTSHHVHITIFDMLRKEYSQAIDRLRTSTPERQNLSSADRALVGHLLHLYWHGELELGESDRLLEEFFANAPAQLQEEFMRQIAWRLRYGKFEVGIDLIGRLQKLWEWRVNKVKSAIATNPQASDLKLFGWWFISGKFDNNWAIDQLMEVLKLTEDVNDDSVLLFQRLVAIAPSRPLATVECLRLIADRIRTKWLISYNQESSRAILSTALHSGDEESRKAAKELVNRLLARRIADFRDLLIERED